MLLVLLSALLVPGTFAERAEIRLGILPRIVFVLMGLNVTVCTLRRMKALSKPVVAIHLGVLLVLGCTVVSSLGYIATVNVYEGTTVDTAYRWDSKRDMPLGVDLAVKKIHMEFYPVPVKVGVLRGKEKAGLFILKTGEAFTLERYTVKVDSLEFPSENLRLSVFNGGSLVGSADTEGARNLPPDFPYDFRLVAYQNPSFKRVWLDLTLSRGSEVVAEGTSEVNRPLKWGRLSFINTQVDRDPYGMLFAGIQITDDPGRPYVFLGFAVIGVGSVMYFLRRLRGHK